MEGKTLISLFYDANKIMKYGILNRIVCESKTGYICNFIFSIGKSIRKYYYESNGLISKQMALFIRR